MTGIALLRRGAMSPDVTPDAVNWADISGTTSGTNANQTISGISKPISLQVNVSGFPLPDMTYSKNGGSFLGVGNGGSFSVSNGDTVRFGAATPGGAVSATVTISNATAPGTPTLDTFAVSLSG